MSPRFEPITGRYLHLDLLGKPHRLYVEEAGQGIPLLCLHTAGSDARQYRGLMNDARITARLVDATLVVEIADDGIGGAGGAGSGLRGLADRVEALGGSFAVTSPPGRGTTIRAEIPCS